MGIAIWISMKHTIQTAKSLGLLMWWWSIIDVTCPYIGGIDL